MDRQDRQIIVEFKNRLSEEVRVHIKKVIVFGSRARDEAAEDSDLDLLVLVDKRTPDIEKQLDDIAYQTMWDHEFRPVISLKVFEESRYSDALSKGFSFYLHVEKEGVSV